ncbi:hypothetical protein NHX12_013766 [Muraenolepis orangiensis]|uniref:SH3 domain-containing protein n=1 Tax=Muraenolepis orangiensis TaxID=630683 RepID=A0A9Q0I4Y8_9TELE|nr:hypothetical protein NHX12_013766 [Muraenolepis orangiensis]
MAEARTDEEEERGLEAREEEQVVRRQPRLSAGGDRPNRRKPEHRLSQGPLSSIRAALKRTTTRSTSAGEGAREREREQDRERDRRRPEITILSAEPLASNSWFPGASGGFPPPPPPAAQIWGPTIPPSIQPPPSYEEVIREKSQEQVVLPAPSSSSSLPIASSSACLRTVSTVTCATQTDPGLPPPYPQCTAEVRRPSRPPRPSFPAPPRPSSNVDDIIGTSAGQSSQRPPRTSGLARPRSPPTSASGAQTDHSEPPSVLPSSPPPPSNPSPCVPVERPRPRPRSNLIQRPSGQPEVKVQTLVKLREDGLATLAALRGRDLTDQDAGHGKYLQELLEAFSSDDWGFPEDRRGESGPSRSESEEEEEEEEEEEDMATLKARIEAFQQQQQPPLSDDCHGDGENAECSAASIRPEPRPRLQGQPAKPAPPTIAPKPKPHCKEFWEDKGSSMPDPEKPPSPPSGSPALKPSSRPRPRPAPRASMGATPPPRPPSLPGTSSERETQDPVKTPSTTTDPVKTGSGRPGIPAKPSSLMASSRRASAPSLGLKPTGSPPPPALVVKLPTLPDASPAPTQRRKSSSAPIPRLSGVKALPIRPPPIKTHPGRPPPPTINPTSSLVANQTALSRAKSRAKPARSMSPANQRPSSLQDSPTPSSVPANQAQGQKATKKGPALPPRPKPGHPLYNSYMKQEVLVVLDDRGSTPPPPQLVKEQSIDQSNVVGCLLDIQPPVVLPGVDSQSKVVSEEFGITDIQSSLMVQPPKQKDPELSPISGPRCVATCDYDGLEEDELTFSQGDVIALSELIGQDWGRGQIHGRTGNFPLNVTQVLEPLPPPLPTATTKAVSLTTDVTILENAEPTSSSKEPANTEQEEWALALFNFPGQTAEDLSFQQGALIRVLQHIDADWRRGRVEDREGLYPVAFTQPCAAQPIPGQEPAGRGVAKALFDFTAESEDELTLKIGDIVREVESLDEQWIVGVVGGKRGMVPKNYISLL